MSKTKLAVYEAQFHGTEINFKSMSLEQCEQIVREELYEGFVRAGMAMEAINRMRLYESVGFASFPEYCKSKRSPCNKTYAYGLIAAASLRIKIGNNSANAECWTEGTLRPYTKIQPQSQAVRLAKKAACIAAKESPDGKVTPKITKAVIEAHTGKLPPAKKKKAKALVLSTKTWEVLEIALDQVEEVATTLEAFTDAMWEDADAERPGCAERLAQALSDLASYIRS